MIEKNYNIKQVAEALGITVRTVRQWIRDGKIKAYKYEKCRMWFIPESEVKRIQEVK